MTIIYPVNQRLLSRKAHDLLIIKTCHALAALGHTVFLVMQDAGIDNEAFLNHYGISSISGLNIISIPVRKRVGGMVISWRIFYRWLCFLKILKLLQTQTVDLIYLSELKLGNYLLHLYPFLKKPIIYEFHSLRAFDVKPFRSDRLEQRVFKKATAVIVTTKSLLKMLETLYGKREGVDAISLASDLFSAPFSLSSIEQGRERHIFYVGQHYLLQGIDLLVEAMVYLPGCRLHTVGGRSEEMEYLKEMASQKGVGQRIHFHGFVPPSDLPLLLQQADIFVIPSRSDGRMPYVAHTKVYEYMAYGKPIVATDLPSIREVLIDQHNAVLVSPDDPKSLAEGIQKVLLDRTLAEKISRNAYETARQYTWEHRGKSLESFFEERLRRRGT